PKLQGNRGLPADRLRRHRPRWIEGLATDQADDCELAAWPHLRPEEGLGCSSRTGPSLPSNRMRCAAPSRSSYCPLFKVHMNDATPARPIPMAIGTRKKKSIMTPVPQ